MWRWWRGRWRKYCAWKAAMVFDQAVVLSETMAP